MEQVGRQLISKDIQPPPRSYSPAQRSGLIPALGLLAQFWVQALPWELTYLCSQRRIFPFVTLLLRSQTAVLQ